ncbi:MAG: ATP-grasp domain-containing protein [Candidatus Firestonebacteria bacterium]|nr:ATP-grasp domain-containing protein [Candidatus Firestonebacteria bacterium]
MQYIIDFFLKEKPDVVIPMDDTTCIVFSKNLSELSKLTKVPIANYEIFKKGIDKSETIKAAQEIGIPLPFTYITDSLENIKKPASYPLVIKPSYGSGSRGIKIANNDNELIKAVELIINTGCKAIIQERLPHEGAGYGISLLFNFKSQPKAAFAHKRLREYPIYGGPSTLRLSIKDEKLKTMGIRLLEHLKWQGVAMVEFKLDVRDNTYKLMEINPRFWGSLNLAIFAGINFPDMLVRLALDGDVKEKFDYKENLFSRWLLPGDILHFFSNPDRFKLNPSFFKFFDKNLVYDILSLDDLLPTFCRLFNMFIYLFDPEMRKLVFRNNKIK